MTIRSLSILMAALVFLLSAPGLSAEKEPLTVAMSIRSLTSDYHMQYVAGAQAFIDTLPKGTAEIKILSCEANDNKQITDIIELIKEKGDNIILFIDPNNARNLVDIANICENAGVYWCSAWNIPNSINPLQYKYWVMHQTCDGVKQGYDIAIEVFKNFATPGAGNLLIMQGMLSNTANSTRMDGLNQALMEYPDVMIMDTQACDWNRDKAKAAMTSWLSVHEDFDGVWCASDAMALGVIEVLKEAKLDRKVAVVGVDGFPAAIAAVEDGDLSCTISNNGWMQGGYGVAYAYAAKTGKLDTATMDKKHRMFYTSGFLVNADTVAQYKKEFIENVPVYDYNNLDFPIAKEMR